MSRDYKVYLEDILEAIRKIREFTSGTSLAVLSKDAKTLDAVLPVDSYGRNGAGEDR